MDVRSLLRHSALSLLVAGPAVAAHAGPASAGSREWDFAVLLDDRPIGTHRFVVAEDGDARIVASTADFAVRILGVTVYRYRHQADERWQGDCLAALDADTDDDGRQTQVRGRLEGGGSFRVVATPRGARATEADAAGCMMSYAYWNPALRHRTRLVNPQTGRIDAVTITPLGASTIDVHGMPTAAEGIRIQGPAEAIDVWYATDGGAWIGLDSRVAQGRRLSYRLP